MKFQKHRAIVPLRGNLNMCPSCGEHFKSVFSFDKHRVGEFGTYDNGRLIPATRRCLNTSEMRSIGMAVNFAGFWVSRAFERQDYWREEDD